MDYNYLVPANSKKQGLIFGIFKKIDLILVIVGICASFPLLVIVPLDKIWGILITMLPISLAAFLVFPIKSYHNVRVFLHEMYKFYFVNRRKYIWRGWCYQYEQSDESNEPNAQ